MVRMTQTRTALRFLTYVLAVAALFAPSVQADHGDEDGPLEPVLDNLREDPDDSWGSQGYPYCDPLHFNRTHPYGHYRHHCLVPVPWPWEAGIRP